jgi:hypothetical protein
MSANAIRAGKAWVEMRIDDKTHPGLAAVQKRLLSWGAGLAKIGVAIHAAGDAILGSLTGAAAVFAHVGSEIFDLSRASGLGAEELSSLGFAAEQSGADIGAIGKAMVGLAKFTSKVNAGNKEAVKSLDQLGISASDFLAATPYQRLLMVADGEKRISDESLQLAVRMKVLGKAGMSLGSLMADGAKGIEELVGQARVLGLTITDKEARDADALGDAWDALTKQFKQIAFVIGSGVAPLLTALFNALQPLLAGTISFFRANQGLIRVLAVVGVVALGAGTAFLGLAGGAFAIAVAMKIATMAVAAYGAVTAFAAAATAALISPMGLIVASLAVVGIALAAAGGYWLWFNKTARAALQGVYDAFVSGNWSLAGQIMMTALLVAWESGIGQLKTAWADFEAWMMRSFGRLADGAISWAQRLGLAGVFHGPMVPGGFSRGTAAAGAAVQREAHSEADRRLAEAQAHLARLVALAAKEREEKFRIKPPPPLPGAAGGGASPTSPGVASGTFNAAMVRLLGNSAENAHERTAHATEAALDKLDEIKGAVEDLDFSDTE